MGKKKGGSKTAASEAAQSAPVAQPAESGEVKASASASSAPAFTVVGKLGGLLEVRSSPEKGRYIVANRAVTTGEVLLIDEHYIAHPNVSKILAVCLCCTTEVEREEGKPAPHRCKKCDLPYCSPTCAKKNEPIHAIECGILRNVLQAAMELGIDPFLLWTCFRIIIAKHLESKGKLAKGRYAEFMSLESHMDKFPPQHAGMFGAAADALLQLVPEAVRGAPDSPDAITRELVTSWIGRIVVNAFATGDGPLDRNLGTGIYPKAALFSHSCVPNCGFSSRAGRVGVHALQDIPAGTELTVSYAEQWRSTLERQANLRGAKFFACRCERCVSPDEQGRFLNGVKCFSTKCGGYLVPIVAGLHEELPPPKKGEKGEKGEEAREEGKEEKKEAANEEGKHEHEHEHEHGDGCCGHDHGPGHAHELPPGVPGPVSVLYWRCAKCKGRRAEAEVMRVVRAVSEAAARARDLMAPSGGPPGAPPPQPDFAKAAAAIEKVVAEHKEKLHKNHSLLLHCSMMLLQCYMRLNETDQAIVHGREVLANAEACLPPFHPERGQFLMALADRYHQKGASAPPALRRRLFERSADLLRKAKEVFVICDGPETPVMKIIDTRLQVVTDPRALAPTPRQPGHGAQQPQCPMQ